MKIIFYAPDSALPKGFTRRDQFQFRQWSASKLAQTFPDAEVIVSADQMFDKAYQATVVEGASSRHAHDVFEFCKDLIGLFADHKHISKLAVSGHQVWIGGFCRWTDL